MPRHGKTAKLVDLTRIAYLSGYKIISAMTTLKIPFIPFNPDLILQAFERKMSIQETFGLQPKDKIFLNLDEITTLGGYNRMSLTQLNIITTFLFMQAGKRRISVGWTAQLWDSVDKNLKPLTSLEINCIRIGPQWNPTMFVLKYIYHDRKIPIFTKIWHPEQFHKTFQLYDTEEPMNPHFMRKKER